MKSLGEMITVMAAATGVVCFIAWEVVLPVIGMLYLMGKLK